MILDSLQPLAVPVDSLSQLPGNPRRGDVDAVAASLSRFGQRKPIVVDADGVIIAGNHTWAAAKQLGWDEIAVVRVTDDQATAQAFALADNRTAELGGYDEAALLDLIRSVGEVDAGLLADTGWDEDSVQDLVDRIDPGLPDLPPEDDAPPTPAEPLSKSGDVWVLGAHRLVVGDATDVGAYDALLGDSRVDCVWTDPPYGVDYVGKTKDALTIKNDGGDNLDDLLSSTFNAVTMASKEGAAVYVAHPAGARSIQFGAAFLNAGWRLHQTLVWDKGTIALGHSDYHYRHEPILYGYTPGGGRRGRGGDGWYGDNSQQSVISVPKPAANREHPTMKPIDLVAKCLNNSAPRGGLVLDPFGGSGSTLMACEYTGRKARLIELDPKYADVICRRWQEYTGAKPVLEATGEPYDFTEEPEDDSEA